MSRASPSGQPAGALRAEPVPVSGKAAHQAQGGVVRFSRSWGMPNRNTFSVGPIGGFVQRYMARSSISIDPFARDNRWATETNDINPNTAADYHMDAADFCAEMARNGRRFDLAIFDPPYSPRQISECYSSFGRKVAATDTQNAALYRGVRDALLPILTPDATVLSFGWNSNGMGAGRGFKIIEVLLVAHGAAHNDTICLAEQRIVIGDGHRMAETENTGSVRSMTSAGADRQSPNLSNTLSTPLEGGGRE